MLIWFAETTLVAGLLAVVAAGAGRLRPIGPTARHLLWLAVLVKLLCPPLMPWPWALRWPDSRMSTPATPEPSREVIPERSVRLAAVHRPPSRPTTGHASAAVVPVAATTAIAPRLPEKATARSPAAPWPAIGRGTLAAWLMLSGLLACGQTWRIIRFRRRLALGVPAPDELIDLSVEMAGKLETPVPELLVVPGLGSPMLWCLGRPRILLPASLVKTLDLARWRAILAHELAHLRRGDHWVSRLELLAGWIWWWNPLYWLARSRLDAEAELACDAWVVWALPDHRLAYAETLFAIGSASSRAVAPAPALGVAGPGRLLERRLTMILRESVPYRLSPAVLLAAALLILFSLPSWSAPAAAHPAPAPGVTIAAPAQSSNPTSALDDDLDDDDDDDADDDDDDDDADDDDDDKAAQARRKAEARSRAEARAKTRAEAREKAREARARTRAASPERKKGEGEGPADLAEKFGPEFEKKMEQLGKEMEAKFGPGSDFEKKMEQLGKEMEAKFGPGSDFEKKMKELGKEMEAKFGPGSDFEKQMKELGTKLGPGSDFEKQMKSLGEKMAQKARAKAGASAAAGSAEEKPAAEPETRGKTTAKADAKAREVKVAAKAREAKARRREARIAALEERIRKLADELKALEAEEDDDRDDNR